MKVLCMSGYSEAAIAHHGIGAAAFVEKPFTPQVIAGRVRQLLDEPSPYEVTPAPPASTA